MKIVKGRPIPHLSDNWVSLVEQIITEVYEEITDVMEYDIYSREIKNE